MLRARVCVYESFRNFEHQVAVLDRTLCNYFKYSSEGFHRAKSPQRSCSSNSEAGRALCLIELLLSTTQEVSTLGFQCPAQGHVARVTLYDLSNLPCSHHLPKFKDISTQRRKLNRFMYVHGSVCVAVISCNPSFTDLCDNSSMWIFLASLLTVLERREER